MPVRLCPIIGQGALVVHLVVGYAAFMHLVGDRDPHRRPSTTRFVVSHDLATSTISLQRADIQAHFEARE